MTIYFGNIIYIFVLLSTSINSFAQESDLVFHNYTKEDGLPSSEVYRSFQDEKGFMWFCTDRGMSRYNGFDFENFTTEDGLTDNVITSYYQETESKFWLIGNNGTLTILEDGKFTAFEYNDKMKEYHPSLRIINFKINNNIIFIGSSGFRPFTISMEGDIKSLFKFNKNISQLYDFENDFLYINIQEEERNNRKIDSSLLIIKDSALLSIRINNFQNAANIHNSNMVVLDSNNLVYNYKNKLLLIKSGKVVQQLLFNSKIIHFSKFQKKIFIGLLNEGAYELEFNNNLLIKKRKIISNISVSNVFNSSDNSLWITSLNKGVFYSINPSFNLIKKNNKEQVFGNELKIANDEILISDPNGYLHSYNTSTSKIEYSNQFQFNIVSVVYVGDTFCYIAANSLYKYNLGNKLLTKIHGKGFGKKVVEYGSGWISMEIRYLTLVSQKFNFIKEIYESILYDIEKNKDGEIFIADKNGLLKLSNDSLIPLLSGYRINDIEPVLDKILCASRGEGLINYSENIVKTYKLRDGLISNQLNHINKTTNTVGWISSNEGISNYSIVNENIRFTNYTKSHGLPSNEVFHALELNKQLFIGSKKGLVTIKANELKQDYNSGLFLKYILLNQDTLTSNKIKKITNDYLKLSYNKNTLEINLSPLCLNCLEEVEIKVTINGEKQILKTTKLTLSALQPDDYNVKFWIKNTNNEWTKANFELNFTIPKPFWLSPLFFVFIFIIILSILGILVYYYNKRSKKRIIEKQESLKFQQSALISQMKPHFIFNSLNSIQHKILQDDKFETHKFVSQFGLLMRKNLDYSEREFITLEEEIDLIKLYLEIENKRLKNKILLSIEINNIPSLKKSKIAPFILQPIIENAIWHGLSKVDDESLLLNISFTKKPDKLTVEIVDNGVGINKTIEKKKKSHESKGSKILKRRLQLLEVKYKYKTSYLIQDLSEENKRGTRVTITLPIIE